MNHTHYALINEDNDVVAVLVRDNFKGRAIKAIEDETDNEVQSIEIDETDYFNFKVKAKLNDDFEYVAILRPTWEY